MSSTRDHMAMLRLSMRRAELADDQPLNSFGLLIDEAVERGFQPLIRPTLERQAEILGVAVDYERESPATTPDTFGAPDRTVAGEIFRRNDALLVATVSVTDSGLLLENPDGTFTRRQTPESRLQVASLTNCVNADDLDELASVAAEIFGVDLVPFSYTSRRFDELRDEGRDAPVRSSEQDLAAARSLSDKSTRALAIAVKASGGLLMSDLPKQVPQGDRDRVVEMQEELQKAGLVERDLVVICKKTSAQINRLPTRDVLDELSGRGVRCACGRPIGEERHEEAIAITDLGRSLLDGSRWFSILLVDELTALGVPADRILVEQEAGGDEMDCIADVSGEVAFFELKDKEFSLGNAYSFGAKMGIVRPLHPVIVTTDRVGNDAKEHFSRSRSAAGNPRRYRTYGDPTDDETRPVEYIEGIESLRSGLERIVGEIYRRDALGIVRGVLPKAMLAPQTVIAAVPVAE
jgi:hypothetical protein